MHSFSIPTPPQKKKSENHKVFWCFQEVEKGCIGNKWVKLNIFREILHPRKTTAWKVLGLGDFSGPYFPIYVLNWEI